MPSSAVSVARCARSRASVPKAKLARIVLRISSFPLYDDHAGVSRTMSSAEYHLPEATCRGDGAISSDSPA
jgi:hypothetical protein